MTRTTITMPDDLAHLVRDEARRRSTTVSEVIRSAIVQALRGEGPRDVAFAAICDEPGLPAGRHLEDELERTWGDDLDPRRR